MCENTSSDVTLRLHFALDQRRLLKVEGHCDGGSVHCPCPKLKSVYGVSRVTRHHEPGPPISMSKVRGPGVEARPVPCRML